MTWGEYVKATMGSDDQKTAAEKARVDQSTVSRWVRTGTPGAAENVAKFARAYKRPVLEAFVQAEFLTAFEAKQRPSAPPDPSDLTSADLLDELGRRLLYAEEMAARDIGQAPGQSGPSE